MIPQVVCQLRTGRDKLFELTEELSEAFGGSSHVLNARTQINLANCLLQDEPVVRKQSEAAEIESDGTEY